MITTLRAQPDRREHLRSALGVVALMMGIGHAGIARAAESVRSVAGFDSIELALPCELMLRQGQDESLRIEAEAAALAKITSRVEGRRLRIGVDGRLQTEAPIRLQIGLRELRRLELLGGGRVQAGALQGEAIVFATQGGATVDIAMLQATQFALRVQGSGEVRIGSGRVQTQRIAISGAGRYEALALDSDSTELSIEGSGEARVAASRSLAVQVAGVGTVRYRGQPAVTRSIQGVGSIEPV